MKGSDVTLTSARSFLFVPGDRPDRFARAAASGADVVILDLEDAVAPDRKAGARSAVAAWIAEHDSAVVRVNGIGTAEFADDLTAVRAHAAAVMLPKTQSADDVAAVAATIGRPVPVVPLIESALGVLRAEAIARADGAMRLALGNVDLGAELDIDPGDADALRHVRSSLVLASAAGGRPAPIDGVTTDLRDPDRIRADALHARSLGFTAKLCIHPAQVPVVAEVMSPSPPELAWARSVLASAEAGVGVVDGHMIDPPVVARARRLLERGDAQTDRSSR